MASVASTNLVFVATLTIREQKQAERRERVIASAMTLAIEGGYEAVQMRDVAARADVAMGTIYRYYSSKDAVLVAGLAEWTELVRMRIADRELDIDNAADRLVAVLEDAAASTVRQPKLMAALVTALASTDVEVGHHKLRVESAMVGLITDALKDFPEIDAHAVARVLGHVWFSAIVSWVGRMRPDESVRDELVLAARLLLVD